MLPLWVWLLAAKPSPLVTDGDDAYRRGDFVAAIESWSQALVMAREMKDAAQEFELLLRLAAVQRRLGKVDTASRTLDLAASLASTPLQKAHLEQDRASNLLARGEFAPAERAYAGAFKKLRDAKDPVGAASAALNLGTVRRVRADSRGAEKAFGAARTLYEALEDRGGLAAVGLQRCGLAQEQGDLGLADEICSQAATLALAVKEHDTYIDTQLIQAEIAVALGRTGSAMSRYRGALGLAQSRKDPLAQARLHNAIGGLLISRADPSAREHLALAESAFQQAGRERAALKVAVNLAMLDGGRAAIEALVPRAEKLDDEHLLATLLLNLAALGDGAALDRAGKLIDRYDHPDLRWRHRYLAGKRKLAANPKDKQGLALLVEAVEDLERRRASVSERDRASGQAFITKHDEVYQSVVDAYLAQGDTNAAFVWANQMSKDTSALDEDPRLKSLAKQQEDTTARLEAAEHEEQKKQLAKQLGELRVEFAKVVDEMRNTVEDFDRMVRVDPEDLEAIQAKLPPGVTVLQPVLFADQLVLMVLRRDHLMVKQVPLDGKAVRKTVRALSRSLQGRYLSKPEWTMEQAEALGDWLLAPIADQLEGTEVLVTSTSGDLREVPFAMLRYDGRYAIQRFAVASVTNVASLARESKAFSLRSDDVLLVGNPDGSLKGAEDEVGELKNRLIDADTLIGPQGTRDAVIDRMHGKQVVHLATHGRIDRDHPTDSYLALAGNGPDGRLSYQEIPGLAGMLSECRLVVLSACQSGVAVQANDKGEGGIVVSINGLAAQFRRAGVETLVASLWSVDDEGTRELMTGMYTDLAGGANIAEALRQSQMRMIGQPEFEHPWYWSSFVVVGDWR